jgi:hypothetical protein
VAGFGVLHADCTECERATIFKVRHSAGGPPSYLPGHKLCCESGGEAGHSAHCGLHPPIEQGPKTQDSVNEFPGVPEGGQLQPQVPHLPQGDLG